MARELRQPDLVVSMYPDRHAPRAARYCVGSVEQPWPELRDSVVLLTSELVSRAVRLNKGSPRDFVELRVWTRAELTRVELRAARDLVCAAADCDDPQDDLLLVELLSDRWSVDADERRACIWFELDRRGDTGGAGAAAAAPRSDSFEGLGGVPTATRLQRRAYGSGALQRARRERAPRAARSRIRARCHEAR